MCWNIKSVVALKYTTGKESWYCSENCKSMALQAKQSKTRKMEREETKSLVVE